MFEESLAITILLVLGLFGSAVHISIIVLKFRLKSMAHSFYSFVAALAVGDCVALLIFMIWCVPCILLSIDMDIYVRSNLPGFIMYVCWHQTEHLLFVISLSRFVAVFYPTKFYLVDGIYVKYILLVTLLVSIVTSIPLLVPPCAFYFDFTLFVYHLGGDECSYYFDKIVMLAYDIGVVLVIPLILNWATFYKISRHKHDKSGAGRKAETNEEKRKRKLEISFFIQSTVTGFINIALVLLFHVVAPFITTRMGLFFATTVAWEFAHVLNGVIFLAGNREARDATFGHFFTKIRRGSRVDTIATIQM